MALRIPWQAGGVFGTHARRMRTMGSQTLRIGHEALQPRFANPTEKLLILE